MTARATPEAMSYTIRTRHLTLRPPVPDDDDFLYALHSDPALYGLAPWARVTDREELEAMTAAWRATWQEHGFGYFVADDADTGEPLGLAGVRPADPGRLNPACRFAAAAQGRGLGRESARAVVVFAAEWLPDHVVEAVIRPGHEASIRTAEAAGLLFYARQGFVEVGRIPGGIRVGAGDDRDDVEMVRRADGSPLVADGRR